jgi:3-oxoacyl-[acyl-carrier-protein] synthase II
MNDKIVITGLGAITPIGNNVPDFWESIQAGRGGIGPITRFDAEEYPSKIAAEIKDFKAGDYMDRKEARKMDAFSQYSVAASNEAMQDAGLTNGEVKPERLGVVYGCGIGGFNTLESSYWSLYKNGPSRIPPMTIPKLISNIGPANIAIAQNAQGPCYTVTTACASGTDAIGNALHWLRSGVCDVIISGGVESCITRMGIGGFSVIQALSTKYNDTPEIACRPFDKDRDGFICGEGAATVVMETLAHAQKRGAKIYGEVAGYGMSCDANHLTAPHPEGRGATAAMRMALADAGMQPEDVDYINAHGTSTPLNDPTETMAIKKVFGDHAYKLKVSSTKSMTGHMIGAAGAIEGIASLLAMRDSFIPPTMNHNEPDEECDLNYVPNKGIKENVDVAMSNSLGFGGHNGILIFKKYQENGQSA